MGYYIIKCCILCVQYSDHYVWDELYCTVLYGCKGGSARGETCCADVFKNGSRNARQGLPLGILFEIIIAVLTYSLIVILHNDMGALGVFFGVVFVMLFMIVLVVMAYAFPMSARFENTIGEIVANSAFMALEHWKETTSLLILQAAFLVGMILIVYIPPIILILPGAIMWMQAKLLEPVFDSYLKEGGANHETETI